MEDGPMTDTLWQSFANASAAVGEAEALQSAIEQALADGAAVGLRADETDWTYESWSDEEDWIASYMIQSIKVRDVGVKGAARGMLSFALSFYRPEDRSGEGWPGGHRAKLYVGLAPSRTRWDEDTMVLDGSGASAVTEVRGGCRWWRRNVPAAWFFCVALDAIDSREALVREVMRPLGALVSGAEEAAAFDGCTATLVPASDV